MRRVVQLLLALVALKATLAAVYLEDKFLDGKFREIDFYLKMFAKLNDRLSKCECPRIRKIRSCSCVCWAFLQTALVFTDSWEKDWGYSKHPGKEFGKFKLSSGKFYNDVEQDKGM